MPLGEWFSQHGFALLQSAGIISSLLFAAFSFRRDAKEHRLFNIHTITRHHRDLWFQLFRHPELARIIDLNIDIDRNPISVMEDRFVLLLVLHLNNSYWAIKEGLYPAPDHLREDIRQFFALPIPWSVWQRIKPLQDRKFVQFVECALENVQEGERRHSA